MYYAIASYNTNTGMIQFLKEECGDDCWSDDFNEALCSEMIEDIASDLQNDEFLVKIFTNENLNGEYWEIV